MGASYTVMEYAAPALVIGLGGILIILVLNIVWGGYAAKKRQSKSAVVAVFTVSLVLLLLILNWLVPVANQFGDLLVPDQYTVKKTAGKIRSVSAGRVNVLHFSSGEFRKGKKSI